MPASLDEEVQLLRSKLDRNSFSLYLCISESKIDRLESGLSGRRLRSVFLFTQKFSLCCERVSEWMVVVGGLVSGNK